MIPSAIVVVLVLAILIFVHELGHFLVAKFFGVGVLEFAIGFGPRILSFRIGETTYSIRAVPLLGGFVRMVGDDPFAAREGAAEEGAGGASPIEGELTDLAPNQVAMMKDRSRWFLNQPYLTKIAVVFAGPLFNFIFAWVLVTSMYSFQGIPSNIKLGGAVIGDVSPGLPAEKAGFMRGDKVISIDGSVVEKWEDLVKATQGSQGKELTIGLVRKTSTGEENKEIKVAPVQEFTDRDYLMGDDPKKTPAFRIGLGPKFDFDYRKGSFIEAADLGARKVYELITLNCKVLKGLFTGILSPSKTIGGPISIITETAKQANEGFMEVIWTMVFLNITLGVMNLLPIPILDGGHITFFTIERLRGRPMSLRFQEIASRIGMTILLFLMIFAVGNDLVRLFVKA